MAISEKTRARRHKIAKAMINDGYRDPDFSKLENPDSHEYTTELIHTMNYAMYCFDNEDQKKNAIAFASENGIDLSSVPATELIHLGTMSWIILSGGTLADSKIEEYKLSMKNLAEKYSTNSSIKKSTGPKKSKKDIATDMIIGELEGYIDDVYFENKEPVHSINEIIVKYSSPDMPDYSTIKAHFERQLTDLGNTSEDENPVKNLVKIKRIFHDILTSCSVLESARINSAPKKARKTTKVSRPRKIVPAKLVKKLKYLKTFKDDDFELTSIVPEKIIGAKTLWVYNTKTRKLGKYVSNSENGFLVKGSTILNFEQSESVCKTVRKPKDVLDKFVASGKVEQRRIFEEIKATQSLLTGRINSDTIILKVNG